MCWDASTRRARLWRRQSRRREGLWKRRGMEKSKSRLSHPAWKSRKLRGIPTFPQPRRRQVKLLNRTFHVLQKADILTCYGHQLIAGWLQGISVAIAKPDGVAGAEHHVVGAGSAHHGLVEVVAHRKVIREILEVGRVALLHVIEAHGGRAFFGGGVIETRRLGKAVGPCADAGFDPGEQVGLASAGIRGSGGRRVAVKLLPH